MTKPAPTPSELLAALADLETKTRLSRDIPKATRHAAFLKESLKLSLPALARSYGIDPAIDFRRHRVNRQALALDSVLDRASGVHRDLPVPGLLAEIVRELETAAGALRRDIEAHLARPVTH
jgi:hypothetical protein